MIKLRLKLRDSDAQVVLRGKVLTSLIGASDETLAATLRPILESGAIDKVT